jgi:hypothetical protein
VDDVDGWLGSAPDGLLCNASAGGLITPVEVNTHQDRVSGFYWFARYSDPAELIEAHDALGGLITALLGVAGRQEREPSRAHTGYWVTSRFAIETYAHDVTEDGCPRELRPTMQVDISDAASAAAREALARAAATSKRWPSPDGPSD